MQITKYSESENIDKAIANGEPVLAILSFDGKTAYVGHIDECFEHHILSSKVGHKTTDIDKFFRIVISSDVDIKIPKRYQRHMNYLGGK